MMIIALGWAFLSFVATRDRMMDGRAETLPGPQWTARSGVQRYDPEAGRSESAMMVVMYYQWWQRKRRPWVASCSLLSLPLLPIELFMSTLTAFR